jgi:hypothetical protein
MKSYRSVELLDQLQSDVRQLILAATRLKATDPGKLLQQPATGKWSVIQVLEHLNSYGNYYLLAIETSLKQDKPARELYTPGWLGNYFTRLMKPGHNGAINRKMQSPKDHRPQSHPEALPVLTTFLEQKHHLLELLEQARSKNIGGIRVPVSLTKLINLKVGDTFRFLIAHEQRHFLQIENTLAAIRSITNKYPAIHPVM